MSIFISAKKHFSDEKIEEIARKTDGLSGGDLEGIINVIQTDVDQQNGDLITLEVIDAAIDRAIKKIKNFTGNAFAYNTTTLKHANSNHSSQRLKIA